MGEWGVGQEIATSGFNEADFSAFSAALFENPSRAGRFSQAGPSERAGW